MFSRIVKLLVSLLVAALDRMSEMMRRLSGWQPSTSCVVLYYHAVRAGARQQFAAQMDELARLSVPIDIEGSEPLARGHHYTVVTFDDAFMSVVENALPELHARRIPCTIFVPTASIGKRPLWIGASHEDATERVASEDVLRTISASPFVRIGSHSVSHPDFRKLDDGQAVEELAKSKAELERIIGRDVTSFSFPHGAHTQNSVNLAKECGYQRVFTIEPVRLGDPRGEFVIGRVRVEPLDWPIEFRLKALGAYRWLVSASALKRRLFGMWRGGSLEVPQQLGT